VPAPASLQKSNREQELQAALFHSGLAYNQEQRFVILNQSQELAETVFAGILAVVPGDRCEWI